MTRTTVSYIAAITAALGVSALVFIAPSNTTNAQTPQEQRDGALSQFLGELATATANYHHSMLATIPAEPPASILPRRIWIDAKFGDELMEEAIANGDAKAGRVSSRFWTDEDGRLDLAKWRQYLTTTDLRNEFLMFGDWEGQPAEALRDGDSGTQRDYVLVSLMQQKYQPRLLWTYYNLGREADETLAPVQGVLDESTFLISSIYLREGKNAGSIREAREHVTAKVSAVLRNARGRPVLVEQQAWIKGGARMSAQMLFKTLEAALEVEVDGDRIDGLILFDNTRNAFRNENYQLIPGIKTEADVEEHERWVYNVFRMAMGGAGQKTGE